MGELWAVDRGRDRHRPRTHWGSTQEGRGLGEEWPCVVAASPSHPSYEDGRTELLVLARPYGWSRYSLRGKPSRPKREQLPSLVSHGMVLWEILRLSDHQDLTYRHNHTASLPEGQGLVTQECGPWTSSVHTTRARHKSRFTGQPCARTQNLHLNKTLGKHIHTTLRTTVPGQCCPKEQREPCVQFKIFLFLKKLKQ